MNDVTTPSKDERTAAMFGHLLGLSGYIVPFGHLIGPFIVWQMKKGGAPFAAQQAKESLNFQITMTIAFLVSIVLALVLIGFVLMGVFAILDIVLVLIAATKANDGVAYRYPFSLRFIK